VLFGAKQKDKKLVGKMEEEAYPTYGVAAVVALMGVRGYTATRSVPSLVAGLVFGGALGASGYLIQDPNMRETGRALALGTSLVLGGVMGVRLLRTGKVYPAGVLATVGLGSAAWHGYSTVHGQPYRWK